MSHNSVMVEEIVGCLCRAVHGMIIDGTFGQGGHTEAILESTPEEVIVVGLDKDPLAIQEGSRLLEKYTNRLFLVHASYGNPSDWQPLLPVQPIIGFLLDLGFSSVQMECIGRGFSFADNTALDMRFNPLEPVPTAADLVNHCSQEELADIFFHYGEERHSRKLSRAIVERRSVHQFETASDLAQFINQIMETPSRRIHPATRIFQALRIAVNHELETLESGLQAAESVLAPNGHIAVISFHSLEDRIVKRFFMKKSGLCQCPPNIPVCVCNPNARLQIITRHPITPSETEIARNPRARSAKLRCAKKTGSYGGLHI